MGDNDEGIVKIQSDLGEFRARFHPYPDQNSPLETTSSEPGILKCLGVSYGRVLRRWAAPRPAPSPWQGVQDLTSFGPACPQVHEPLFAVPGLPVFGPPSETSVSIFAGSEDEFRCLNLNVFAPVRLSKRGKLEQPPVQLPVLVWVHGGAFRAGCGGLGLYDGSPLVTRSLEIGHPVIVVTLNYRLGVLGFIHSQKLLDEAATQVDVPEHCRSTANLALLDISMAITWVKRHIGQFGGDPHKIMGFGESAGSALLNYLALIPALHPKIPRMLYSSSNVFSVQLLQSLEGQNWFDAICDKHRIPPGSIDVVDRLRQVDVDTLVHSSHFACSSFRPILDGVTIPNDPRAMLSGEDVWDETLREIVFGHCENEAWIKLAYRLGIPPPLAKNIAGRIPPVHDLRHRAQNMYGEKMDSSYLWYQSPKPSTLNPGALSWMALDGHSRYYVPSRLLAQSFVNGSPSRPPRETVVYRYIFAWTPAQWPENWPATHTADLLPMFLHNSLSEQDMAAARNFADQIILFASAVKSGKMCWKRYDESTAWSSNVFERNGSWVVRRQDEGEFGLNDEAVALWEDVFRTYLDWEKHGWEGMIR